MFGIFALAVGSIIVGIVGGYILERGILALIDSTDED